MAQRSGRHPHVRIFVPILVLSRSEFGSQQVRPGLCLLIKAETILQETPAAVNHLGALLARCSNPCACHAERHLNAQKWSEHVIFNILTWKCALRHNGVHFFDISTSKSGPGMVCFLHVDFEMCFAPQRCPLFRHLNFQKWSKTEVF